MTATLLDISRVRVGRVPLRLDRVNLVAAAQRALALHASDGEEIRADLPTDEVWVTADAARVGQIIATVTRYLRGRTGSGAVAARLASDPDIARLEVWDDGEALDPDHAAEVFTRLIEPATDRPTGWKIARPELYVARGLAAAHGGSLVAESPVGTSDRGVKFVLTLPLVG
jgi:signal transduction histidine kinase